jgi:xylan 1,4-beta-xylosidase
MFSRLGPEWLEAKSSGAVPLDTLIRDGVRELADVGVLASRGPEEVAVLVWHYHDDAIPGPEARVRLVTAGLPEASTTATLTHYRVDDKHSNAYTAWLRLGSPAAPSPDQYAELLRHGELGTLEEGPTSVPVSAGRASVEFPLPRHGVSLLVFSNFTRQ